MTAPVLSVPRRRAPFPSLAGYDRAWMRGDLVAVIIGVVAVPGVRGQVVPTIDDAIDALGGPGT